MPIMGVVKKAMPLITKEAKPMSLGLPKGEGRCGLVTMMPI